MKIVRHSLYIPTEESLKEQRYPDSFNRRTPRIWKIAYSAVNDLLFQSDWQPEAIVCGTALGALNETIKLFTKVHTVNMGAPAQFIASVHNSVVGMLAMQFGIKGTCLTACDSNNSLASAITTAMLVPEKRVLVLIIDESIEFLDKLYEIQSGNKKDLHTPSEGALALLIDKEICSKLPQITASAIVPCDGVNVGQTSVISSALELNALLEQKQSGTFSCYSHTAQCSSTVTISY